MNVIRVRGCEVDGNADMGDGGGVVVASAGHEYVGGARGSGMVSSAADVLGMIGVGGVCEMWMCLQIDGMRHD